MPDVAVRRARPEDIPAVMALHERCWRISYAGLADADAKFARGVAAWERLWAGILDSTRVVELHGAVAGFVVFGPSRDADAAEGSGEIQALYVDPDAQGAGLGAALVARAGDELAAAGYERVTLWTFEHNPDSRGFYERLGFAWDGTATRDDDGPIVRYARPVSRTER
jgi:ribosomal protein S18 acetylase RimI-like enzyme